MIINPISSPSGMKPIIRVTSPIGSSVTCNGETKTVTDTSVDFTVEVVEEPILPSGYVQLDSITSDGNVYIDTGVKPTSNTKLEIEFKFNALPTSTDPFGAYDGSGKEYSLDVYNSTMYAQFASTGFSNNLGSADTTSFHKYRFNDGLKVYIDDVEKVTMSGSFTSTQNIYLCGLNSQGTFQRAAQITMKPCKISSGSTVNAELVPCKRVSDNLVSMYDITNNTFRIPQGSGSFTAGNVVPTETRYKSYTVTASKDGKTQSKSVTVDAVALFPVTLDYKLYLYNEGDECEDVTGGYAYAWYTSNNGTYTRYSDHIYCNMNSYDDVQATQNLISFSGYSKVCVVADANVYFNSISVSSGQYSASQRPTEGYATVSSNYGEKLLSTLTDNYHLGFSGAGVNIYKIWLE